MDAMFQALLSWQFLLFCLAIAAITFVVRKIVEYILDNPGIPASKTSKLWTDLILPILPVILGCVCGVVAKKYPYPDGLNFVSGRVAFGLVGGLLSGLVYRVINSFLLSRLSTTQSGFMQPAVQSFPTMISTVQPQVAVMQPQLPVVQSQQPVTQSQQCIVQPQQSIATPEVSTSIDENNINNLAAKVRETINKG